MASPRKRDRFTLALAAAGLAVCATSVPCALHAQVMEVGGDGSVAVYSRPTVFTDTGAAAIATPSLPPAAVRPTRAPSAAVARELAAAADAYALSPALVEAVARQESGLRHDAVSRVGATGVMQLMPKTAAQLGVDRYDLRQNIYGGAAYLSKMIARFGGDVTLGLAAYNAGPEAVARWGGVPPYAETRAYVASILNRLAEQAVPTTRSN